MPNAPKQHRPRHYKNTKRQDYRKGSRQRGYDSRWEKLRAAHIAEHPICEDCWEQDGVVNAESIEVDHVVPIEVAPERRLDPENLRTRCKAHHQRKTIEDRKRYGAAR